MMKLYERRYWDVSAGMVRAVFDVQKDAGHLNHLPDCDHFMIWLDSEPEELMINVGASIVKAAKARGHSDPCKHSGMDFPDNPGCKVEEAKA